MERVYVSEQSIVDVMIGRYFGVLTKSACSDLG
jgi:hypothetical protein